MEKANKNLNRIKVILAEKNLQNKWLADTLGKDCTTVSKWCTNTTQHGLETLVKIAECLDVDARELIVPTKKRSLDCRYARTYDSLKWR